MSPAHVHVLTSYHDLFIFIAKVTYAFVFHYPSTNVCSFAGCFPLRERPLYAISDGEVNPVDVGAPVFGTYTEYVEFRRMRHDKTLHR